MSIHTPFSGKYITQILLSFLIFGSTLAFGQSINNLIFIGTSNTDTGRCLTLGTPATCNWGPYTNPNGSMWSVTLGSYYGIGVTSNLGSTSSAISPGIGLKNNYAQGGSKVYDGLSVAPTGTYSNASINVNVWSGAQQINSLISGSGGRLNANAIYIYEEGTNDLKSNYNNTTAPIATLYAGFGTGAGANYNNYGYGHGSLVDGINYSADTTSTSAGYMNIAAGAYNPGAMYTAGLDTLATKSANNVITMAGAGAKYIVATNVIAPNQSAATAVGMAAQWVQMPIDSIEYYNQKFWNNIKAAGVNFIPADFSTLFNYVAVNANSFGFTNHLLSAPLCGTTTHVTDCTAAIMAATLAANPGSTYSSYLFADVIGHFASGMQDIQAQYVQSLIVAPSQISMLAESAIQNRSGLINTFHQQIPLAFQKSPGLQMWMAGDVFNSSINQSTGFPNSSGTPYAITIGVGFRNRPEWTFGGAVSSVIGTQTYSTGGKYSSNEYVLSAYAGYESEQYWANGVFSYGNAAIDSSRIFALGITSQGNYGSVSGSNISLSAEGGYKFMSSLGDTDLEHSPLVGLSFQNSYVGGFSERNPSSAPTALSFGSQNRNSTISKFGYQANMQLGMWKPFARISWNNELASTNRDITTSLLSTTAPSYTMPAVQLGTNWTQGQLGVHYKFSPTINGYILINGQYSQNNAANSSGSVAINISL